MIRLAEIEERTAADRLCLFGAFHPTAEDRVPFDCGTLVLLGPAEPGFWAHLTAQPEFNDDAPNPIDRWSAGALAFAEKLALPEPAQSPCESCETRPCLTACPVGALSGQGYDLAAYHAYLDQPGGRACLEGGCQVRGSCPVSRRYGRLAEQSAFHMARFHP